MLGRWKAFWREKLERRRLQRCGLCGLFVSLFDTVAGFRPVFASEDDLKVRCKSLAGFEKPAASSTHENVLRSASCAGNSYASHVFHRCHLAPSQHAADDPHLGPVSRGIFGTQLGTVLLIGLVLGIIPNAQQHAKGALHPKNRAGCCRLWPALASLDALVPLQRGSPAGVSHEGPLVAD